VKSLARSADTVNDVPWYLPISERLTMSLDERIRQLSETIIQEVRGPIDTALHGLLADVMTVAAADRDQAVRAALAEATASHEAALAALREQLDRERETALAAAAADIEREREVALAALREDLARDHETALKTALEAAGEEAGRAHRSEVEAIEARAAADRDAALQAVREEFALREENAVSAARTAAETAAGIALTAALAAAEQGKHEAEARAAGLERERDQALTEAGDARQAVRDAEQKALEADQHAQEAHVRLRDTEQQAQDAQAKLLEAERQVQDAQSRLRDADELARDHERRAALVHAADRQQDLACSDRTLASFRRLDAARSLTEVLAVLAEQAAVEIGRVAILTVHGTRLRGWDVRGFPGLIPASIDAPVEHGSVFGLAIGTGLPVSTADAPLGLTGKGLDLILAVPTDRAGLAVPIAVGGRVVAILYADDGGDELPVVPSSWPEIAEILARHAGHRLEVLTVSHAAMLAGRVQQEGRPSGWPPAGHAAEGTPETDEKREEESARRYARLLISEIKLYNEPAVEQGREHRDLLRRLGAEIERARRLYEDKIPAGVRQRADCFDQEVVRTLAGGDPGLLG
jgi:hypothetical protein